MPNARILFQAPIRRCLRGACHHFSVEHLPAFSGALPVFLSASCASVPPPSPSPVPSSKDADPLRPSSCVCVCTCVCVVHLCVLFVRCLAAPSSSLSTSIGASGLGEGANVMELVMTSRRLPRLQSQLQRRRAVSLPLVLGWRFHWSGVLSFSFCPSPSPSPFPMYMYVCACVCVFPPLPFVQ